MSKAHWDHYRYIAFKLEGPTVTRRAADHGIRGRARKDGIPDDKMPQLTRYEWPYGIVKIDHKFDRTLRDSLTKWHFVVMQGEKVRVDAKPLSTSGTIKALTTRLGVLQKRLGPAPGPGGHTRGIPPVRDP